MISRGKEVLSKYFTYRRLSESDRERLFEVNIGPQHPASGHMRIIVRLDGDLILDAEPDIGYVHRSMEKLAENVEYIKAQMLFERAAILDSCNITLGYIRALEKLLGVEAPPRAKYLRTLLCEIDRIASHLYGFGIGSIMLNHSTMYMWSFGLRELWVQLAEDLSGARLTHAYNIPGGVRADLPKGFKENADKAIKYTKKVLKDMMRIFFNNPNIRSRLEGVGVLRREDAIRLGIVGPNLRASGVRYDARLVEGYGAYSELEFEVPVRKEGDCLARYLLRVDEIEQSMRIIKQALKDMPEGRLLCDEFYNKLSPSARKLMEGKRFVKFPAAFVTLKPEAGEATARVEMGHGEVFYHLISDGSQRPYRVRVVTPSFRNLILFRHLSIGERFMDIPAIYGSIDYFPPEADR